jgi:hypothetical protein
MRSSQYLSVLLLAAGLASASPIRGVSARAEPEKAVKCRGGNDNNANLAKAILAIMPKSNTCEGAKFPDECRTAEQAAPYIAKSYASFSKGELAAALALMGLESDDLKYKHNVYPGVPGQGTANMMSPSVSLYFLCHNYLLD